MLGGEWCRAAAGDGVAQCILHAAAGGIIRHVMKSLEEIGILEKSTTIKGGRVLTAAGRRDMDLIAGRCTVNLSVF
jgi:ribosomal protein S19E (S16A)